MATKATTAQISRENVKSPVIQRTQKKKKVARLNTKKGVEKPQQYCAKSQMKCSK